ncbi:unnamed protein product [Acanthoscelides obtectus]|uniref:Uncharacterized protein n=1 Tax=Acanthoscelides obtectus TaxID=200917 RepID=A0A9P0QDN5_ACAOB|nr:unnamed protein product [Acanthoscelides obtectus]CAK1688969.1 hypothetical protein AOBTE_LOCUS36971 [Acanthoscelides obtectus]
MPEKACRDPEAGHAHGQLREEEKVFRAQPVLPLPAPKRPLDTTRVTKRPIFWCYFRQVWFAFFILWDPLGEVNQ